MQSDIVIHLGQTKKLKGDYLPICRFSWVTSFDLVKSKCLLALWRIMDFSILTQKPPISKWTVFYISINLVWLFSEWCKVSKSFWARGGSKVIFTCEHFYWWTAMEWRYLVWWKSYWAMDCPNRKIHEEFGQRYAFWSIFLFFTTNAQKLL